ncbi:hypothetical protein J7F03_17315 [Streptomyces sp. ISL-43]|uniref:hypothetical protein n=1 Tax=Streptomyces sp. ISL-43 TaxID=2819183 RepID=UPI001BE8DA44|nr:hypothetical protein [Streptomyces sp. ISL-43]MBT2448819.1 hypothetical protein [Streptomyces sp. ISL-43]
MPTLAPERDAELAASMSDDLFDLDVQIEVTTKPEAGWHSIGCSITCSSCIQSTCYC